MITTIQFEKCVANIVVFYIIIGKFSHWQRVCLIVLPEIQNGFEMNLHGTVLLLGLANSLRVEVCKKHLVDAQGVAEL